MNEPEVQNEEQVLLVVHKHWMAFVTEAIAVAIPGAIVLLILWAVHLHVSGVVLPAFLSMLIPLSGVVIWVIIFILWTDYYLDMLVVTDRRVFYTSQINLANRTVTQWNIPELGHVRTRVSGVAASFFNYGVLELVSRDGNEVSEITGVPNPESISTMIKKQDDRYGTLQETTTRQRELLHFLSHEVKGHLTKSKAAFAAIVEGDYGPVPEQLQSMAHDALSDSQKGVDTVMSILGDADTKRGTLRMESKFFDLSEALRHLVNEFRPVALQKRLQLQASIVDFCIIKGDEEKITRHVIRNLLDNAIRYTPQGMISVKLEKMDGVARFSVTDTGVGMAQQDIAKLFTQGGTSSHSKEVNPESTGYGLFIAKQIVDAHEGRIWAHSQGLGSGSQFFAEFPLAQHG